MKRSKLMPLSCIISAIAFTLIIAKPALGDNLSGKLPSDKLEDIENAIIIKGIKSGNKAGDGHESDDLKDIIIYSGSFDDIRYSDSKKHFPGRAAGNKEDLIKILKKQDNKWHLTRHLIKKGENLRSIAKKYNTDHKMIIKANNINDPDRLNPGNTILIPNRAGINHKVSKDETLLKISKKYGVKIESILSQNNIKKDVIKEGELLFIPDAVAHSEKIVKPGNIKKGTGEEFNEDAEAEKNLSENPQDNSKPKFIWPLKGKITSAFGKRLNPVDNRSRFHCGLDINANIGSPVMASAAGEAIFSGWKKGYGRIVILKHAGGYITVYAHNKKNMIKTGDAIEKGEIIALSGTSGAVTGTHLHFEIRKYLTPLNPLRFLE